MTDYSNEISKLRNLKCYQNKSDNELIEILKKREQELYTPSYNGLSNIETKWAKERYKLYRDNYPYIDSASDLQLLETVVWLETVIERYKKSIEQIVNVSDSIKTPIAIPETTKNGLLEFQEQHLKLKEKLGLFEEKKQDSFMTIWSSLIKKIEKHAQTHAGAFTFRCPKCGALALLVKKIEDYKTCNFSMFRGTFLYNEYLFDLVYKGQITLEDVAKVWEQQTTDYVKGMYDNVYLVEKKYKEQEKSKV